MPLVMGVVFFQGLKSHSYHNQMFSNGIAFFQGSYSSFPVPAYIVSSQYVLFCVLMYKTKDKTDKTQNM